MTATSDFMTSCELIQHFPSRTLVLIDAFARRDLDRAFILPDVRGLPNRARNSSIPGRIGADFPIYYGKILTPRSSGSYLMDVI
jgi:hypothetical protein